MAISQATTDRLTVGMGQLFRVGRHLLHRAAHEFFGDLPSFGWAVMAPLEADGEQRLSALAGILGVDVSVASRQVAALQRSGYVQRRPDPQDGRACLIGLTDAGSAALGRTRILRAQWTKDALAEWDEQDAALLSLLIERLAADLSTTDAEHAGRSSVPQRPSAIPA